jgi:uncharacterized protein (UPF0212 family)
MAGNKWCPKCGGKFPIYFQVCPECQVDLTDQRPGPAPTPNEELVRVFVATDEPLVELAKSLLEGESIEYLERGARLQDLFGWGRFGTGYNFIVGPVEFWVRADEAERARACLEGLEKAAPEDTAPPDDDSQQGPNAESK